MVILRAQRFVDCLLICLHGMFPPKLQCDALRVRNTSARQSVDIDFEKIRDYPLPRIGKGLSQTDCIHHALNELSGSQTFPVPQLGWGLEGMGTLSGSLDASRRRSQHGRKVGAFHPHLTTLMD